MRLDLDRLCLDFGLVQINTPIQIVVYCSVEYRSMFHHHILWNMFSVFYVPFSGINC